MDRRQFIKACAAAGVALSIPASPKDGNEWVWTADSGWTHIVKTFDGLTVRVWVNGEEFSDFAVWDTRLTNDEINQLAAGIDPMLIRFDELRVYRPLTA